MPRYFGSREGLFREIAEHAVGTYGLLNGSAFGIPVRDREMLMSIIDDRALRGGHGPLRFLLPSLGSPADCPIARECPARDFTAPMAAVIAGFQRMSAAHAHRSNVGHLLHPTDVDETQGRRQDQAAGFVSNARDVLKLMEPCMKVGFKSKPSSSKD